MNNEMNKDMKAAAEVLGLTPKKAWKKMHGAARMMGKDMKKAEAAANPSPSPMYPPAALHTINALDADLKAAREELKAANDLIAEQSAKLERFAQQMGELCGKINREEDLKDRAIDEWVNKLELEEERSSSAIEELYKLRAAAHNLCETMKTMTFGETRDNPEKKAQMQAWLRLMEVLEAPSEDISKR